MFKWGIRNRLMVSYFLLVGITMLTLGGYILWYFHRHNVQTLTDHLFGQAVVIEQLLADSPGRLQNPADLEKTVKELAGKTDLRITVINPDGRVTADAWENPATMDNHADRPEVAAALTTGAGSAIRFSATLGENALYVAIPIRQENTVVGVVRVSNTLAHVEQGFRAIRTVLLAAFFISALLALSVGLSLARTYTRPLEEIIAVAGEIAEGKLDRRVHVRTGDEIEILAHTLNHLASNLDDKVNEITAEKSKLELILQHTNSAVLLLDRFGQVVSVNKMAVDTFNIAPDMVGQHNLQVIGNSHFDIAVQETAARRQNRTIDLKTDLRGVKRAFQVFLAPIAGGEQGFGSVLAVFHDITALRELQEKQTEFIANASHELATPLTSIKGFAETLLDGAAKDPELSARFIGIIHAEADRMQRLVKDLLQLAKLDSQDYRVGITTVPIPVEPVVDATVGDLAAAWQNKQLTIHLDKPPAPLTVMASADWLKQVLVNLLDNSIKYTPPGGQIWVKWREEDGDAVISVRDTGVGIPPQELPRIFDRFYRVDKARTRSAGGTGLGLAIVKFIVEIFGGRVEAKSDVGVGTTITCRLPLAK